MYKKQETAVSRIIVPMWGERSGYAFLYAVHAILDGHNSYANNLIKTIYVITPSDHSQYLIIVHHLSQDEKYFVWFDRVLSTVNKRIFSQQEYSSLDFKLFEN